MPKNRVLQARITSDTHEKLTEKCSKLGCSITDYVTSVLNESFDDDSSDIEPEPHLRSIGKIIKVIPTPTIEFIPELRNVRVIND